MRVPRFYQPNSISVDTLISLDDNAVQHIARVLRMRAGESIILFNGNGNEYSGTLVEVAKRKVTVNILDCTTPDRASPLNVQIGQSISRGERMDFAVQKSTELGVNSITPLISERCEVKLNTDRLEKKQRQWQQLAISACEQSLRTTVATINPATSLEHWLQTCTAEIKLVLHHHSDKSLDSYAKPTSVALLVGPEGGLTQREVDLAINAGFKAVALGPRVMRTETAPVAALSVLQFLWGDFS